MKPSTLFASCALALTSAIRCHAISLNNTQLALDVLEHFDLEEDVPSSANTGKPVEFWNCKNFDGTKAGFVVSEIALSPNPPVRGTDLDIIIKGELREQMEKGASVQVTVWKWGHAFTQLKFDWCDNVQGVACPVQPGNVTFSKTQDIDAKIPPLTFTLSVETFNKQHEQISCLLLKAKVAKQA